MVDVAVAVDALGARRQLRLLQHHLQSNRLSFHSSIKESRTHGGRKWGEAVVKHQKSEFRLIWLSSDLRGAPYGRAASRGILQAHYFVDQPRYCCVRNLGLLATVPPHVISSWVASHRDAQVLPQLNTSAVGQMPSLRIAH